jgi:NADH-quinone oxidoreductase subunit C
METQNQFVELISFLTNSIEGLELNLNVQYDTPILEIEREKVHQVLALLKKDQQFGFSFLTTMCGIHFPDNAPEKEFALMYQLHNMAANTRLRIKTYFAKSDLSMNTITDLWQTANWMEREAFDFYGFNFVGHPSLSRILNMDEMNYHPLRKEYALEDGSRSDKEDKYFGR